MMDFVTSMGKMSVPLNKDDLNVFGDIITGLKVGLLIEVLIVAIQIVTAIHQEALVDHQEALVDHQEALVDPQDVLNPQDALDPQDEVAAVDPQEELALLDPAAVHLVQVALLILASVVLVLEGRRVITIDIITTIESMLTTNEKQTSLLAEST